MPDPEEHAESRGVIENILRRIPGFSGYLDRENRRASDQLTRQWIAERLQIAKQAIDQYTHRLADAGQIDQLPAVDRLRGRLDRLVTRVRGAPAGYSGFFDLVQVDEELLEQVYEHDIWLMDDAERLAQAVEQLRESREPPLRLMPELLEKVDEVDKKLDERKRLLEGLDPTS